VELSTRGSSHIFWKSHDWESNIVTEKGEEPLWVSPLPIMPYELEKQTISGLIAFKFARIIYAVFCQSMQGNNCAIAYLETRLRKMLLPPQHQGCFSLNVLFAYRYVVSAYHLIFELKGIQ